MDFKTEFLAVLKLNKLDKFGEYADKFETLCGILLDYNTRVNLTAIRDVSGVILKHFIDSLAVADAIPNGACIADIGSGAGFPALPLAIVRDDLKITAIDSTKKKTDFIEYAAKSLGLANIKTVNDRAEIMGHKPEYREKFDAATARAVTRMNALCELCIPLVKIGGIFAAMKSRETESELPEAERAIQLLGGNIISDNKYTLTDGTEILERDLIIIQKKRPLPEIYPRNGGAIAKKPLI